MIRKSSSIRMNVLKIRAMQTYNVKTLLAHSIVTLVRLVCQETDSFVISLISVQSIMVDAMKMFLARIPIRVESAVLAPRGTRETESTVEKLDDATALMVVVRR